MILQRKLILGSAVLLAVLHLVPFITGQDLYPIVKYEMFAYLKAKPDFFSYVIHSVDKNNVEKETSFLGNSANLFYPYNRRGLSFTISDLLPKYNFAQLLSEFYNVAKDRNHDIVGLKLYSIKCGCDEFKDSHLDLDSYIKARCQKNLMAEHYAR